MVIHLQRNANDLHMDLLKQRWWSGRGISILCAKYYRNRSTFVETTVIWRRWAFFGLQCISSNKKLLTLHYIFTHATDKIIIKQWDECSYSRMDCRWCGNGATWRTAMRIRRKCLNLPARSYGTARLDDRGGEIHCKQTVTDIRLHPHTHRDTVTTLPLVSHWAYALCALPISGHYSFIIY